MIVADKLENSLQRISAQISDRTGRNFQAKNVNSVAGGCINTTLIIDDGAASYFVKLNAAQCLPMFAAETDGLRELAAANTLRVPSPMCHGKDDVYSWLVPRERRCLLVAGTRTSTNAWLTGQSRLEAAWPRPGNAASS